MFIMFISSKKLGGIPFGSVRPIYMHLSTLMTKKKQIGKVYLFICCSSVSLSFCPSERCSVCPSQCLSVFPVAKISIRPPFLAPVGPTVHFPSAHFSACPFVCLFATLYVRPSNFLSVHLFVRPSVRLTVSVCPSHLFFQINFRFCSFEWVSNFVNFILLQCCVGFKKHCTPMN